MNYLSSRSLCLHNKSGWVNRFALLLSDGLMCCTLKNAFLYPGRRWPYISLLRYTRAADVQHYRSHSKKSAIDIFLLIIMHENRHAKAGAGRLNFIYHSRVVDTGRTVPFKGKTFLLNFGQATNFVVVFFPVFFC